MDMHLWVYAITPICALLAYIVKRLGQIDVLDVQQKSLNERLDKLEEMIERLDAKVDKLVCHL